MNTFVCVVLIAFVLQPIRLGLLSEKLHRARWLLAVWTCEAGLWGLRLELVSLEVKSQYSCA